MNNAELRSMIETYADCVTDSMDIDDLIYYVKQSIIERMEHMGTEDIKEKIKQIYPEILDLDFSEEN